MRLAPEGKDVWGTLAGACLIVAILAAALQSRALLWVAVLIFILFILTALFFRDPERCIPDIPGAVVSPADGRILEIKDVAEGLNPDEARRKVSIFMSLLDVHVNRIPIGGVIQRLEYNRGRFLTAFHSKASLLNEQQRIAIEASCGSVECVQVAGWLARRIVCHLKEGQQVQTGERFGMIRFGSRLDLYLPPGSMLDVSKGQKVRAGETVIGVLYEKK